MEKNAYAIRTTDSLSNVMGSWGSEYENTPNNFVQIYSGKVSHRLSYCRHPRNLISTQVRVKHLPGTKQSPVQMPRAMQLPPRRTNPIGRREAARKGRRPSPGSEWDRGQHAPSNRTDRLSHAGDHQLPIDVERHHIMEGYLIRLPASAWNVDNDTTSQRTARRSRRSFRPQARLLYYVLGEGYLEGFASPDDVESVESFQLTSFEVGVDPIYSMCIFKVTTHKKRPAGQPVRDVADTPDDNSDNDDEAGGSSLLLFAADRTLVELWGRKLLNWNRYVFAGAPFSAETSDLGQAKRDLITAFHEKNNHGMFSVICSLQDCTTTPGTEGAADQCANTNTAEDEQIRTPPILPTPMPTPTTIVDKLQESATRTEIKPLWMLLHRGSSRRIRSVPMTK